jgi:hypothetical protein
MHSPNLRHHQRHRHPLNVKMSNEKELKGERSKLKAQSSTIIVPGIKIHVPKQTSDAIDSLIHSSIGIAIHVNKHHIQLISFLHPYIGINA